MDMCTLWTSVANPLESPINCVVGAAWCWCCPTQVSHSLGLCKLTSTHSHHDVTAPCAPKQTLASVGMTRLTPTTIQTAKENLSTSHPTLLHMTARKSHHPTATGVNASALASSHATQTLRPIRCHHMLKIHTRARLSQPAWSPILWTHCQLCVHADAALHPHFSPAATGTTPSASARTPRPLRSTVRLS